MISRFNVQPTGSASHATNNNLPLYACITLSLPGDESQVNRMLLVVVLRPAPREKSFWHMEKKFDERSSDN